MCPPQHDEPQTCLLNVEVKGHHQAIAGLAEGVRLNTYMHISRGRALSTVPWQFSTTGLHTWRII